MERKQEIRASRSCHARILATGRPGDPIGVRVHGSLIGPKAHTEARKAIELVQDAAGPGAVPIIDLTGLERADRMGLATVALAIVLHLQRGGHVRVFASSEISAGLLGLLPRKCRMLDENGPLGCSSISF